MVKKQVLKISAVLCILMFLAIPLLSSPVAANGSCYPGTVDTAVDGGGASPDVIIDVAPGTIEVEDDEDHTIDFYCEVVFTDYSEQTAGSNHIATMDVWESSGTPWTFVGSDTTGTQFLDPNNQYYSNTLFVSDNYGQVTPLPKYTVIISASVTDIAYSKTTTPTPGSTNVDII